MPSAVERLLDAAQNNRVGALKVLLAADDVDVNAKDNYGRTALHLAAKHGHADAVKVVLAAAGVNVNVKDRYGHTALHFAAQYDRVDALRVLFAAAGVDVNAKTKDGRTALHSAAFNGHADAVKVLLAAAGVNVNAKDENGYTALHLAAQNNCIDALKVLLAAAGVDVNAKDTSGNTALHFAAQYNHVEALKVLLAAAGVNVNAKNTSGNTALHFAAQYNRLDALKLLLAAAGVNVNAKSGDGYTALHVAAQYNRLDALKLLLAAAGVNVNAKSGDGYTALHVAMRHDDVDALKVLLAAAGVDVTAKNIFGYTALHHAAQNNRVDALKVLLAAGVDVNAKNTSGNTALHVAMRHNHVDTLKVLLAADGVDVSAKDGNGQTALEIATQKGHAVVLEVLQGYVSSDDAGVGRQGLDTVAPTATGHSSDASSDAPPESSAGAAAQPCPSSPPDVTPPSVSTTTMNTVAPDRCSDASSDTASSGAAPQEASSSSAPVVTLTTALAESTANVDDAPPADDAPPGRFDVLAAEATERFAGASAAPTASGHSSDASSDAPPESSSGPAAQTSPSSPPDVTPLAMSSSEDTMSDRRVANVDNAPPKPEWPGNLDVLAADATERFAAATALLATQDPNVQAALDRFRASLDRLRSLEGTAGHCGSAESTAELQDARAACVEAARVLTAFPRDTVPLNDAVAAAVAAFEREIEDFRRATAEIAAVTLGDPCRARAVQAVHRLRRRIEAHDETQSAVTAEMTRQIDAFDGEAWAAELSSGQAEADAVFAAQAAWCGESGLAEARQRLRHRDAMATKVTLRRREHGFAACNFDNKLPGEDAATLQQRRDEAAEALAAAEERLAGAEADAQTALLNFPGLTLDTALGARDREESSAESACQAARAGDLDVLQGILLREPSLAGRAEANGEPLLHHGVRSGDGDVVRLILSYPSVDPLRRSRDGTLALELAFGMPDREILGLLAAPLMAWQNRNPQTPSAASVSSMFTPRSVLDDESLGEWSAEGSVAAVAVARVAPIANFSRAALHPRGASQAPSSARRVAEARAMESDRAQTARTSATRAGAPVILDQVPPHAPADGPFHTMAMYAQRDHALPEHDAAWEDASMMPAAAPPAVAVQGAPGLATEEPAQAAQENRLTHASAEEPAALDPLEERTAPTGGRVSPSGSSAVFGGASAHTGADDDNLLLVQ